MGDTGGAGTGPSGPATPGPGRFWSLLVGLSLTGGFTFGALLAWLA